MKGISTCSSGFADLRDGNSTNSGTYLPNEGDIAVRVWQTTAAKPFREIPTTPFTRHAYGDKAPLDVDAAVEDQPFLGIGASMTDASAWLLSRMPAERRRAFMEAAFSSDPAKGAGLSALRSGPPLAAWRGTHTRVRRPRWGASTAASPTSHSTTPSRGRR